MIHQYKNNGYNIVLDVNSGAVHVVDDVAYDVIPLFETNTKEEIIDNLKGRYNQAEIAESYEEVRELVDQGSLFTKDQYQDYIEQFQDRPTVVKALCLHIAHDCNLACRYCFAEEGEYHGRRALMSFEVGKAALDFLVANSGNRRNLEVDCLGGKQEIANVVLSIDGRKEVHDKMRPFRKGAGSYDLIVPKFQKLAESRNQDRYYVRGTFTHHNLDFSKDVLHLADLGFSIYD